MDFVKEVLVKNNARTIGHKLNAKRKKTRISVNVIGLPRIVFSHVVIAMINKMK